VYEGEYGANTVYVNGKIRPVQIIPGEVIKANDGGGEFKYDIFGIL
jgi:hypothetical protein